jgi:hypothetical protein
MSRQGEDYVSRPGEGASWETSWTYYPKQVIIRALTNMLGNMTYQVQHRGAQYVKQSMHPDIYNVAMALAEISKRGRTRAQALEAAGRYIEGSMGDELFEACQDVAGDNHDIDAVYALRDLQNKQAEQYRQLGGARRRRY